MRKLSSLYNFFQRWEKKKRGKWKEGIGKEKVDKNRKKVKEKEERR